MTRCLARRRHLLACVIAAASSWFLVGVAAAQLVDVSNQPLYSGVQPHPNVIVAASVEFPTVGAAFLNVSYSPTAAYVGYFDSTKCYQYNSSSGGYFYVLAAASARHECAAGTAFSGNFMNWLTMSAIDEFRYVMTGGNRDDENGPNNGTIIMRAYLPDGTVSGVPDFYALPSNFPRHLQQNGQADYVGGSASSAILPTSTSNNSVAFYITSCKTQVYFGSQPDGTCTSPRADYATFNVRVNVCDSAEGPVRTDLCLQYGGSTGKYKPVGQAQQNANRMRFSAFGFLMDHNVTGYTIPGGCDDGTGWNRCRYGGVLRSPMKYLGPTKYDANQLSSANANAEINADGTLVADPDGTASTAGGSYSGFINFINRFGATGTYKRLDPMGEMFYEAIRYYQGLQPTASAYSGAINNAVKDNFPIYTNWTDPISSICAANYIINVSDANTWDDTYLPGYSGSPSAGYGRAGSRPVTSGLDAYSWTAKIAALESSTSSLVINDVRPNLSNIQNQNTGASGASYLVAGAAYWANTNDVRSDLLGKQTVKTISVDVAEGSNAVPDRQLYLMGKYGGFNNTIDRLADGSQANPFYAADPANPAAAAIRSNSEWEDIPGSGYPSNYLLASSPQKLITGLQTAFSRISAQTGTLTGAAVTSTNLTYGAAGAYVAQFNPARWSGTVLYYSIAAVNGTLSVSASPIWDSGALLTARCGTPLSGSTTCTDTDTSANRRNIVTTIKSSGTKVGKAFTWTNVQLDTTFAATLNTNPNTGVVDNQGQARVNYLRGYRADEASALGFRVRDSAQGDIVNSGPVYVGPPTANIPDASYQSFYTTNLNRQAVVYAGANDGMLHSFNATTGAELFGYIPNYAIADLNDLTNPNYLHETFVDSVPTVQEVQSNGIWKTVLVGGAGASAQGVYAIDVSNPATFDATKVVFEFSDADDADLGNVVTPPEFVKLRTGGTKAAPTYTWFAAVTGYNNKRTAINNRTDTLVSADNANKGFLFLLSLDRTIGTPWVLGTNYYKYTFPAADQTKANGLGPVVSLFENNATTSLYFGDLQGQFWRFNTTGLPAAWKPARGTVASPKPMFNAVTTAGARQPITSRPVLAAGPFGSTLVVFGTGEYLGQTDLATYTQQSEYAFLDFNDGTPAQRSDLATRTGAVSGGNVTITGSTFSYSGPSAKRGWVYDFPTSISAGERSINQPAVRSGFLTFTTLTLGADICKSGGGYIYQVNVLTGLPFPSSYNGNTGGYASTVGIPGPPRIVDLALTPGAPQATGETISTTSQTTIVSGTNGALAQSGTVTKKGPPTGQISWREISNFNDRTGH